MLYDPFKITWLSVSCTKEFPEDTAIPLKVLVRSNFDFFATAHASPNAAK